MTVSEPWMPATLPIPPVTTSARSSLLGDLDLDDQVVAAVTE
jgi:hypothetical protein